MAIVVIQIVSEDVQTFLLRLGSPNYFNTLECKGGVTYTRLPGGYVGSRRSRRTAISEEDMCASPPSGSFPLGVRVVEKIYKSKFTVVPHVSVQLLHLLRETVAGNANRNRVGF